MINKGDLEHELVMDTIAKNEEHKAIMEKFPEMEQDGPNAIRLEPGAKGEIIWTFANAGSFQFACLIPGHMESGMHGPITVNGTPTKGNTHETVENLTLVATLGVTALSPAFAEIFTKGTVKRIDAKAGKVTFIHEELVALEMPAMTMVFRVAEPTMLEARSEGKVIMFVAERKDGKLTVTKLQ